MWSKWTLLALFAVALVVPIVVLYAMTFFAGRPANLGVKEGKLAPCPASPNCVSSQAEDAGHRIDAIRFAGTTADALAKLKKAILTLPRAAIVTESADYLHVECTSLIFRFVDDVEFWIDEPNQVIHCRSASRVGHGDFGVNRKRMEGIREAFEKGN